MEKKQEVFYLRDEKEIAAHIEKNEEIFGKLVKIFPVGCTPEQCIIETSTGSFVCSFGLYNIAGKHHMYYRLIQ